VADFGNALVSRRQQCKALQELSDVRAVSSTEAFDFVHVVVSSSPHMQVGIFAAFDNLRSGKPTRLEVVQQIAGGEDEALDEIAAQLLQYDRLDRALIAEFKLA